MSNARNLARLLPDSSGKLPVSNIVDGVTIAAGDIAYFAKNSAPTGYLKANGAAISRTTYATLFAAIGTTFGTGDGSTTFNVPDLRGEFPRGWDDSRGVDSGRAFGSAQSDAIRNITGHIGMEMHASASMSGAFYLVSNGLSDSTATASLSSGHWKPYFDASRVVATASENRPRSIALLACIKY